MEPQKSVGARRRIRVSSKRVLRRMLEPTVRLIERSIGALLTRSVDTAGIGYCHEEAEDNSRCFFKLLQRSLRPWQPIPTPFAACQLTTGRRNTSQHTKERRIISAASSARNSSNRIRSSIFAKQPPNKVTLVINFGLHTRDWNPRLKQHTGLLEEISFGKRGRKRKQWPAGHCLLFCSYRHSLGRRLLDHRDLSYKNPGRLAGQSSDLSDF